MTQQPPSHPNKAPGYPDRSPHLDARPGFKDPPPGYGEVPFWWWSGDDLDVDRLLWQLRELGKKGVSGVQVNYSHVDSPGWLTDMDEPGLFTDAWWNVYSRISEEWGTWAWASASAPIPSTGPTAPRIFSTTCSIKSRS